MIYNFLKLIFSYGTIKKRSQNLILHLMRIIAKMDRENFGIFQTAYIFLMINDNMSKVKIPASCRNCRKSFNAKNTLFCSMGCYKFYTNALDRNIITSLDDNANQTEKLNDFTILKRDQINCTHEYSKNGTMSCRKCGHSSVLIN